MADLTPDQRAVVLKQKITTLYTDISAIAQEAKEVEKDKTKFDAFRGKYKMLDSLFPDVVSAWDQLYELLLSQGKEATFPYEDKYLAKLKSHVSTCHSVFESIMNPVPSAMQTPANQTLRQNETSGLDTTASSFNRSRLPKIQIPSFNGDILKWPQFRDLFVSLIHDEGGISAVEKFQHLIARLAGEPLQIVSAFTISELNYNEAWNALKTRYDNKRVLGAAYMQKIRQFKSSNAQGGALTHLRSFLKNVAENFSAIKALGIENEADFLKLHIALEALHPETRQLYEEKQQGQEFPTYESLVSFIHQRCQVLELADSVLPKTSSDRFAPNTIRRGKVLTTFEPKSADKSHSKQQGNLERCSHCQGAHPLFRCFSFRRLPASEKYELAKKNQLCYNCLRKGHTSNRCSSDKSCSACQQRHHSALHSLFTNANPVTDQALKTSCSSQPVTASATTSKTSAAGIVGATAGRRTVLLGTAIANIRDCCGINRRIRIVIDSGSQFSVITADCAERLGFQPLQGKTILSGIGLVQLSTTRGMVDCQISPLQNDGVTLETKALVMPVITSSLPTISLNPSLRNCFQNIQLADPEFWESKPIDFLLGSDLFLQILVLDEPAPRITNKFGAIPTVFGHVVMGTPPVISNRDTGSCLSVTEFQFSDKILRDFWEIEEALVPDCHHPDEVKCEEHFKTNHLRLPSGRYVVALPLRNPDKTFPNADNQASRRFFGLESKFSRNIELKRQYVEFMEDYVTLGHMEPTNSSSSYVIPHHAIFKRGLDPAKQEKIRVVFDASMKTSTGSLNDNLFIGKKLQTDIASILLNFRCHRIAFCTDIVKMFRQILVRSEDRRFQHIFWRYSSGEAVQKYELKTLTYGLASSPFLALRVLQQLAEDEGHRFPKAARVLKSDVYVDDIITGEDSVEQALELKNEIINILNTAGFLVHKWATNSAELLRTIPDTPESQVTFSPEDSTTKVLGMRWNAECDNFSYHMELTKTAITKRAMLSVTARLYDPLGLLAPVIFVAKSMIQKLWTLKIGWDDILPPDIVCTWTKFMDDLTNVSNLSIPRWICLPAVDVSLFGFCDASEKGYAAAIFIRIIGAEGKVCTFLLKSKTRLAPIKTITIPRLELCAAHLLTNLLRPLEEFQSKNRVGRVWLFTDSTIVLSWLQQDPSTLKTFVSNRVGHILTHTELTQWRHVPSAQNPADIASRGQRISDLIDNSLWWNGPDWMKLNPIELPSMPSALSEIPEIRQASGSLVATEATEGLASMIIAKYSSFRTAIRVTAYVRRFCKNIQTNDVKHKSWGPLSVFELSRATDYLLKETQLIFFEQDFDFKAGLTISTRFKSLAVFQDKTGILRVGGRLKNADLPEETKHPILLPPQAPLTALIIDYVHIVNFHLGPKALQANLQRQYYIFSIKSLIRKRVWNCVRCFKMRAKPNNPFMADLPWSRVSQGRPFLAVGVDFAGPFTIKLSQRRNSSTSKAYLCVFVCMAVKAVHLELVSALTTEAFLATFERFISRRGLPRDIYSDCGTNFVGAARELKELYIWFNSNAVKESIANHASHKGVQWHFNPPSSPHFGGLWEAAVKSAKSLLLRTLGNRAFFFEELTTLFARIEAILNSRPLCSTSTRPLDFDYLTPGHFLIGSPLTALPEQDLKDTNVNRLTRWQLIQHALQIFWRRWSEEYVHTLHTRTKWTSTGPILQKGELALIQEPNVAPLNWRLGRIEELHPGKDNIVRVATIRTSNGLLKRPVHRLAILPRIDQNE